MSYADGFHRLLEIANDLIVGAQMRRPARSSRRQRRHPSMRAPQRAHLRQKGPAPKTPTMICMSLARFTKRFGDGFGFRGFELRRLTENAEHSDGHRNSDLGIKNPSAGRWICRQCRPSSWKRPSAQMAKVPAALWVSFVMCASFNLSLPRHSGMRQLGAGPEIHNHDREYGFRASLVSLAPRNDVELSKTAVRPS